MVLAVALYYARMFFVTAGYHRYFSHRSFKTSRAFQFILAFLAMTSSQKGILWWAAHHRNHHRLSDTPEDLHSPSQQGFWWSHLGWILSTRNDDTQVEMIRDYYKYPELRWLNDHFLIPPLGSRRWNFPGGRAERMGLARLGLFHQHRDAVARLILR